jgi:hypothetical protein
VVGEVTKPAPNHLLTLADGVGEIPPRGGNRDMPEGSRDHGLDPRRFVACTDSPKENLGELSGARDED